MKFKKMAPIIAMLLVVFLAGCTKKENTSGVPTVTLTDPANLGTGMVLNKVVKVTFSLPMDPSTFTATTFTLKQGSASVSGTVAYAGTTASFTPTNNL